jgi:thiamine biosynthesis lipoprotein
MRIVSIVILSLLSVFSNTYAQDREYSRSLILMGSAFEITVVAPVQKEPWATQQIELAIEEIRRIEKLISSWDEGSQTAMINSNSGVSPVKVDRELFDLIDRAIKVSRLTEGAFDLSFSSLGNLWRFDGTMASVPSEEAISRSVGLINYNNIILDSEDTSVFLAEKGMKIGFGAIGKGYAANRARDLLKGNGVKSGVVNASGDLAAWGSQPGGRPWKVGIADPTNTNKIAAWFSINDMAVITSGDYEKFTIIEGKKYAHIIDPRTGWPARGVKSVTVICSNAELADALATALFVMGRQVGLDLVNQLNGIECLYVDDNDRIWVSNNLKWSNDEKEVLNYRIGAK